MLFYLHRDYAEERGRCLRHCLRMRSIGAAFFLREWQRRLLKLRQEAPRVRKFA